MNQAQPTRGLVIGGLDRVTGVQGAGSLSDRPSALQAGPPPETRLDFRQEETPWEGQPFITEVKVPDNVQRVGAYTPPFRLYVNIDGEDYYWAVASERSTVIDGTNGPAFDLAAGGADWGIGAIEFDTETLFTETSDIVLEADIDEDLVPSNWTLAAKTVYADSEEVLIDEGPPIVQTKARLLIGTVYVETVDGELSIRAEQAVTSAQCLGHSFYQSLLVRSFKYAPTRRADPTP